MRRLAPRAPFRVRAAGAAAALAALLLGVAPARAYFEDQAVGAHVLGMGQTGAAFVEDVTAYYWNPAGLAELPRSQAFATYGQPLGVANLMSGTLAGATRIQQAGAGAALAWHHYAIPGAYDEDLLMLSAGRMAHRWESGHRIDAGLTLKVGRVGIADFIDPDGATVSYGSKTGFSFDTGVRWRTPWRLDVAWVGRDWASPDYQFVAGSSATAVKTTQTLGLAYRWNPESTVTAQWTSKGNYGSSRFDVGIEIWFYNVFAIRSGLTDIGGIEDPGTSAQRFQYAGGIGLKNRKWQFDAAVATNRDLGASYRLSLIVPFGKEFAP